MNCPICHSTYITKEIPTEDNQQAIIYECYSCGSHFFPPLLANFISEVSAKNLDSVLPKQAINLSTQTLYCPSCQEPLTLIRDDSVPSGVTVYTCPNNHGNLFPIKELLSFKQAQKAKINYHQIWGIPLRSALAVFLPVFVIFTALAVIPLTLDQIKERQDTRISASSPINEPLILTPTPNQAVISFTTKTESITYLQIKSGDNAKKIDVSSTPRLTHTITLNDLEPNTRYSFTISSGKDTSSDYSFVTPAN